MGDATVTPIKPPIVKPWVSDRHRPARAYANVEAAMASDLAWLITQMPGTTTTIYNTDTKVTVRMERLVRRRIITTFYESKPQDA